MSVGTPFHPRTAPLNRKMQWREWSGYFASSVYADAHDIEYNAIREAAALIDVSPLYKYAVSGPDALRLVDRVITRDATKLAPGGVLYTPWCDEHGKVVDDGTIHRLDDGRYRWTAADPQLRWLRQNSAGLDVTITEETEATAALALQGPLSRDVLEAATGESFADLRYFRRRASKIGKVKVDVSRTGYTGDLGYEVWIPTEGAVKVWDALIAAGKAYGIRPAGMLALDVVRLEAGLILLEVDYTSARHAMNPEQNFSPGEIGLGRLVDFDKGDFVGRLALEREVKAGGPARRLVGLQLDWYDIEGLYDAQGLPPAISPTVGRDPVPVFAGGRQVGRATSHGWSPILKQAIALASVAPQVRGTRHEPVGRVDRRGPARAGRGDRRRDAIPRPGAQAREGAGGRAAVDRSRARGVADATRERPGRGGRSPDGSGCHLIVRPRRGSRTAGSTSARPVDREERVVGNLPRVTVGVGEVARRPPQSVAVAGLGGCRRRDRRVERGAATSGVSTLIASVMPPNRARGSAGSRASSASSCHGKSPRFVSAVRNQAMTPSIEAERRSQPSAS